MNKKTEDKIMETLHMPNQEFNDSRRLGFEKITKKLIKKHLKDIFLDNRNDYAAFNSAFEQAISGSGDELFKMNAPWSSSLCALLFFFGVRNSNKIEVNGIKYDKVFFEVKNEVFDAPSNMDVVLLCSKLNKLLFIECKFSEYLTPGTSSISDKYLNNPVFNDLVNKEDSPLKMIRTTGNSYKALWYKGNKPTRIYADGIKQIIAHSIGLKHYKEGIYSQNRYDENDVRYKLYDPKYEIAFMELVFKFDNKFNDEFSSYHEAVTYLFSTINDIDIVPSMTYQELLEKNHNYKLNQNIKNFYRYK